MSSVTHAPVWYPPAFPEQGRLPTTPAQVHENDWRQDSLEQDYQTALSVAANRRVMLPCCFTLHVRLFFDGTGNNLFNDLYRSPVPNPSNIARLFRATVGNGYVGGAAGIKGLTDPPGTGYNNYFKYYVPGVGTPFPEIGELDYSFLGLAFANNGEERINWGLMMVIDALRQYLKMPRMDDASLLRSVREMSTMGSWFGGDPAPLRAREFNRQLDALREPLSYALQGRSSSQPKLLGIKLYVYGFSRGAAAARAFVTWLNALLIPGKSPAAIALGELELPVIVQYLGLLDTVASVGMADPIPGANGHLGWADNSQQLPGGGDLVKRCLHLVAAHEQRLCFPLESIRRETGGYPVNSQEVVYPGVHSDVGGGYPPGDQGKATGDDDRLLLSQIALGDLYADAFLNGAPFKVPRSALGSELQGESWRAMRDEVLESFAVSQTSIHRFNAWREVTLSHASEASPSPSSGEDPRPFLSTQTLEQTLATQLGWLTAWRIDRYAFASLEKTDFYRRATNTHADPAALADARKERTKAQLKIESERRALRARAEFRMASPGPLESGLSKFDPDLAQTQLRAAAEEFGRDFRDPDHLRYAVHQLTPARMPPLVVYDIMRVDAGVECLHLKAAGRARLAQLFPPPAGYFHSFDAQRRGPVDERLNASQPEGLLRALFDDHVHDSRAWFFYSMGREPMGSYFRHRMVFFGDASKRELALNEQQDNTLLAAHVMPVPRAPMTPERMAEIHRAVSATLEAYARPTRHEPS